MSLTFPAEYANRLKQNYSVQDWLLELSDSGSGTLHLAGRDHDLGSTHYYGVVKSWGAITESIDLRKSRARVGDVKVTLLDRWANSAGRLSAELFNRDASAYYLNQACEIRGWLPGITSRADCPVLFPGYLRDIQLGSGVVVLRLEVRLPWDRVMIPDTQIEQAWQPVVYGDFAPNASLPGSEDECTGKALWPAPALTVYGSYLWAALHDDGGSASNVRGHFWDKNYDKFIPIQNSVGTGYEDSPAVYRTGTDYALKINEYLPRVFWGARMAAASDNEATDYANITETGAYAYADTSTVSSTFDDKYFSGNPSRPDGNIGTALTVTFDFRIEIRSYKADDPATTISIDIRDHGGNILFTREVPGDLAGFPYSGSLSFTMSNPNDVDNIKIRTVAIQDGGSSTDYGNFRTKINNLRVEYNCEIAASADVEARTKRLNDLKAVYTGADGLSQSFTGGSGVAQYPPDVFRDLLKRFAGVNLADSAIDGIGALDTARSSWPLRWWIWRKQMELAKVLQQVQFEGGFVWLQDGASAARVVYVKSSYSSGDVDYALTGKDIRRAKVELTPLEDVVPRRKYWYNRHPATEEHQNSHSKTGTNTWGTTTDEIQETKLDMHYDDTAVTNLADYYHQIDGEPKLLVSGDLVNPQYAAIQVGDIVTFGSMPFLPFGEDWSDLYFMVIRTARKPGVVGITAREVYRS